MFGVRTAVRVRKVDWRHDAGLQRLRGAGNGTTLIGSNQRIVNVRNLGYALHDAHVAE
jgi:hypothetical protein